MTRRYVFAAYNLILAVLSPIIALGILYRVYVSRKSRDSWRDQLGHPSVPDEIRRKRPIWVHAVSVGESVAAAKIVSEMKRLLPDVPVVVSSTTRTGREMAQKSIKDADLFIYYPFDLSPCVSASIRRVNPRLFASVDTEIWPNFRHIARQLGVKSAMMNGTVSDRTTKGARRLPWMYRWALGNIDLLCMQSEADAERIVSIGADESRVMVTGNCKADESSRPLSQQDQSELRSRYGFPPEAPVFVAGSTNPGEEESVIAAYAASRQTHPTLKLIIAPRHVERGEEIRQMARSAGFAAGRRSEPATITGAQEVVVLDTFGELANVYAIADVTFVGGTLIRKGGHSLIQPIAQGKPVFFGPHTFKTRDIAAQALSFGVGFRVVDERELAEGISRLTGANELLKDIAERCAQMMEANRGASARTAQAVLSLLADRAR